MIRIKKIQCLTAICFAIFFVFGCNNDEQNDGSQGDANIYLSVRTASSSINEDRVLWEDRVDELRMIVFDTGDGHTVFNEKLYFPNGFAEKSKSVRLRPGTYDFYFIANETVYEGEFVSAITSISNKSEFNTDPRFTTIVYNPDFKPDGMTQGGRFLMSAMYENITIVSGRSEENPLLLPLPTEKVELIRSLAKVEVVFRKKVSGSSLPENAVTSIQLYNVASNLSVPPYDNYYTGETESSKPAPLSELNYTNDSIGAVIFYIPEFLNQEGSLDYTELVINNKTFPVLSDGTKIGIAAQRRTVPALSDSSVIRNYHYIVNAYVTVGGEIEIRVYIKPWSKDKYIYIFEGDKQIVLPPVIPTDSSIIIPTDCGKIEMLSYNEELRGGLQGAYNDVVNYYDPQVGGPVIYEGDPPYYCEKKYGTGWRLINSCELLSFLSLGDQTYNVWMSNTWEAQAKGIPFYPLPLRQAAQSLLEKLTGKDLSATVLYEENNWSDQISDKKLDMIDRYFTPGDIKVREMDFPGGWPYPGSPGTPSSESWYYNEASIQVKAFWYNSGYVDLSDRSNWYKVLYGNFVRYDYSSTVSRCVRSVE